MKVVDLGRMPYLQCASLQMKLIDKVADGDEPSTLLLVEHDPVITLGAGFHEENLLLPVSDYRSKGIAVEKTTRGGDVTYHGPGQLVIYPIFNLDVVERDLHRWMRDLEETMIVTLASYELTAGRFPPNTGCWVNDRKVAAIGVKVRRWVSMHGIALNCDIDLAPYETIVPCGIRDYGVTSLTRELGRTVTIEDAKPRVLTAFQSVFAMMSESNETDPA